MRVIKELGALNVVDLHLINGGQAGLSVSRIEYHFGDFMKVGPRLVLSFLEHINQIFKNPFYSVIANIM